MHFLTHYFHTNTLFAIYCVYMMNSIELGLVNEFKFMKAISGCSYNVYDCM